MNKNGRVQINRLTLKFKSMIVEKLFELEHHGQVIFIAGMMVFVVLIYHILDFSLEVADKVTLNEPKMGLIWNALISLTV